MSAQGRSLELFFIDGRPDGMLTAEVFNWTGHVLRARRTQLKEALQRREAGYTGVYLLFGENEGRARLYIGEAEDMRERLRNHAQNKDWWDYAVLISAAADVLHKAHVKYLESRLVEIARDVGGAELENGNQPTRSSLSEAATANMESFIDTLMMVLPAIRVDAFLNKKRSRPNAGVRSEPAQDPDEFTFAVPRHGVLATAVLKDGEMIVKAGSVVRAEWVGAEENTANYSKLHRELVANGIIVRSGLMGRFSSDYAFSSASAAAAVVAGRSTNGRRAWIHKATGRSYADWEDAQLSEVPL